MTSCVHLASSGELGGAERVILDILRGLAASRPSWKLALIVPREGPLAHEARAAGVTVVVVPWRSGLARLGDSMTARRHILGLVSRLVLALPGLVGDSVRLRRVLGALRPSLVHAHGFKMQVLGMWARPWRTPLILHLHDYVASRRLMSRLLRLRPPGSVAAIAISESVRDDARGVLGPRLPIEVVHNGIDTAHWNPNGPALDLDRASGLRPPPDGTVRIGFVATMARWKGQEVFLRALALLPRDILARGYVIGGPIYETDASQYGIDELRRLASALGLGDRVGFTGFVREPECALRALDIVVHASTRPEPFGRVIIEGMATARAVIARSSGGAAELFEDGVEAIGCRTGDPAELAAAMARVAGNETLRRALGKHGRARVEASFTSHQMSAGVAAFYDQLLKHHRA